jgi:hypothetical protein
MRGAQQQHERAACLAVMAAGFAAGCVAYANSLHGDFVIDDSSAVRTNQDLRPETPLVRLLHNDFWGRPLDKPTSNKSYRPLAVLSFRANFVLHGLDVWGYHFTNVILHACCSSLAGLVCKRLIDPGDATAASLAALSFAIHPVHVEAVAGIVGRAELLCCFFYLLCLLSHAAGCRPAGDCQAAPAPAGRPAPPPPSDAKAAHATAAPTNAWGKLRSALWLLLAALMGILASASKETGLTAWAAASAIDILRVLPPSASRRDRIACVVRLALFGALTTALLWLSRTLRGADLSPYFSFVDNPLPSLPDASTRALTRAHVHVRYARLLLWPQTLSADYSFDCIPAVTMAYDARNLASLSLYAGLCWAGVACLVACRHPDRDTGDAGDTAPESCAREASEQAAATAATQSRSTSGRGTGTRQRAATGGNGVSNAAAAVTAAPAPAVPTPAASSSPPTAASAEPTLMAAAAPALVILVVPMIPALHVFVDIGTLVAERLLYTPSVGYCTLLGLLVSRALRRVSAAEAEHAAPRHGKGQNQGGERSSNGSPGVGGSRRRAWWARNALWVAVVTLLALGLGRTVLRNRDWASSHAITAATARACPGSAKAQLSMGTMHLQRQELQEARASFRRALAIHPQYPDAIYWLGRVAFMEGRVKDAEPLLQVRPPRRLMRATRAAVALPPLPSPLPLAITDGCLPNAGGGEPQCCSSGGPPVCGPLRGAAR